MIRDKRQFIIGIAIVLIGVAAAIPGIRGAMYKHHIENDWPDVSAKLLDYGSVYDSAGEVDYYWLDVEFAVGDKTITTSINSEYLFSGDKNRNESEFKIFYNPDDPEQAYYAKSVPGGGFWLFAGVAFALIGGALIYVSCSAKSFSNL